MTESRRCPQNASRFQRYPIFAAAIVVAGVISGLAFSVLYDNSALPTTCGSSLYVTGPVDRLSHQW